MVFPYTTCKKCGIEYDNIFTVCPSCKEPNLLYPRQRDVIEIQFKRSRAKRAPQPARTNPEGNQPKLSGKKHP